MALDGAGRTHAARTPDATNTHFLLVRKSVVITTGMVSTRTKQMSRRDIVEKWRGGKRHVKHLRRKADDRSSAVLGSGV